MRIPRLHVHRLPQPGEVLSLEGGAARHVRTVLRLRPGAAVVLFDGCGGACEARLLQGSRGALQVQAGTALDADVESPLDVVLALGVSRGERMDLAVQKAVELGVAGIVPLLSERSVVRLDAQRAGRRQAHWQAVAVSACEQCGRNRVPPVAPPVPLHRWLGTLQRAGARLMPHPGATTGLAGAPGEPARGVTLLVGPEGGLAEGERELAVRHGFTPVSLGPRVLRTETAVIAALAAIMTLWGDLAR